MFKLFKEIIYDCYYDRLFRVLLNVKQKEEKLLREASQASLRIACD